jgi:hypothetical protein
MGHCEELRYYHMVGGATGAGVKLPFLARPESCSITMTPARPNPIHHGNTEGLLVLHHSLTVSAPGS